VGILRVKDGIGSWATVSVDAAGPTSPQLLRLKLPDGVWLTHVAPDAPGARPLRLKRHDGSWVTVLYVAAAPAGVVAELNYATLGGLRSLSWVLQYLGGSTPTWQVQLNNVTTGVSARSAGGASFDRRRVVSYFIVDLNPIRWLMVQDPTLRKYVTINLAGIVGSAGLDIVDGLSGSHSTFNLRVLEIAEPPAFVTGQPQGPAGALAVRIVASVFLNRLIDVRGIVNAGPATQSFAGEAEAAAETFMDPVGAVLSTVQIPSAALGYWTVSRPVPEAEMMTRSCIAFAITTDVVPLDFPERTGAVGWSVTGHTTDYVETIGSPVVRACSITLFG